MPFDIANTYVGRCKYPIAYLGKARTLEFDRMAYVKHDDVFDGNSDLSRYVPFFLLLQLFPQLSFFEHYLF
jgi:hypothetical protein